jgi:hypothetical protein
LSEEKDLEYFEDNGEDPFSDEWVLTVMMKSHLGKKGRDILRGRSRTNVGNAVMTCRPSKVVKDDAVPAPQCGNESDICVTKRLL